MPFRLTAGSTARHVYLIGICGTAMGSLAMLLKEKGFQVSGSDTGIYPPMSDLLAAAKIPVRHGFRKENLLPRPDLVVVGNAIARGNEELEFVLDSGIAYTSLPEILRLTFLGERTPLVVTGTHGKTTTAAMLAWALENLGASPSFFIGGVPINFGRSARLGQGSLFVIEGDEYDTAFFDKAPKFFHYRPDLLIINSIEYDHADIYPDLDAIMKQFRQLVNIVPANGFIAYNTNCPNSCEAIRQARCETESVGLEEGAVWRAVDLVFERERTRFDVLYQDRLIGNMTLAVPGSYNVMNCLAGCSVLHHLAYPWEGIKSAMERFQGVERRMTLRGTVDDIRVYDDFAHHPTAIRLALAGARARFPQSRIWAVFEPRSWTCCRDVHQEAMRKSFVAADAVIIAAVYRRNQLAVAETYRPEDTVAHLNHMGKTAHYIPRADEIVTFLAPRLKPGDVVVIMSNGGFDDIHPKLLAALEG
ncbi:MAG: UDP-N-acetylmuramate:L-alanyl-gamma-D-glutamyl-meso-diaminopimelate ligase [Acidobacteria bacterium]|nr:UDP-N-acetylmuramate:L-alanyl-gamma-D-glutamyl-meso-diaminopimelate ligase [Acidobacteriota bacterium]